MPLLLRLFLLLLLCLIGGVAFGQNLVPNPSFEIFDDCPHSVGGISEAPPWRKVAGGGGIPLYNDCGYNGFGTPSNWAGSEDANTGVAYTSIIPWLNDVSYDGNFIGVPLGSTLNEGHRYLVEFHLSLMDSMLYALRNIGASFSSVQPPDDIEYMLGLEPQVRYNDTNYLEEKDG